MVVTLHIRVPLPAFCSRTSIQQHIHSLCERQKYALINPGSRANRVVAEYCLHFHNAGGNCCNSAKQNIPQKRIMKCRSFRAPTHARFIEKHGSFSIFRVCSSRRKEGFSRLSHPFFCTQSGVPLHSATFTVRKSSKLILDRTSAHRLP